MKKLTLIFILISFLTKAGNPPSIIFKENKGQWPEKVLFGAGLYNTQFYVNKNSFNYCVYSMADLKKGAELHHEGTNTILRGHNYEVEFLGGDLNDFTKTDEQKEYYNYFLGNKRSKWANHVKAFTQVQFNSVYGNIDLKLYSKGANLKYDLIVKPGGNSNSIQLQYKFIDNLSISDNDLIIKTSVGEIIEQKPYAFQIINRKEVSVKCSYILLKNNTVGFSFPEGYNKNYELVIDPTVLVCSYSDFTGWGACSAAGYDDFGNIYVAGYSRQGYPTSVGAFSGTYYGAYDIVLSKYNSAGSSKLFSTYLGGDSIDFPYEIIVKNSEITLASITESEDFPCSFQAYDSTRNGRADIVITKLNLSGSALIGSTYIGGSKNEGWSVPGPSVGFYYGRQEIVIDSSGNVYGFSNTNSPDFPVTTGAVSTTLLGPTDGCVYKFDKTLSNLIWCSYLGGTRDETGTGIRLDGTGGVYLCGTTTSTNFPTTSGVVSPTKNGPIGNGDMFLTHLNNTGSGIITSSYIGSNAYDYGGLIDLDQNNDIYISGYVATPGNFTSTPGVYSNAGGYNTIYKVNSSLTSIVFKTKFGNAVPPVLPAPNPYLLQTAFKVDSCFNIYIAGYAENMLPTTANQLQPFAGNQNDIYIAHFNANCSSLKFASFWGGYVPSPVNNYGDHCDGGINQFDSRGRLYQALCSNGGLPTTSGAYNPNFPNIPGDTIWNDAFVKIDLQSFVNAGSSYGSAITGCPPFTPTFVSTTNTGTTYWNLGNGVTSTSNSVSTTYTNLGTYNVLLVVTDTSTCNKYDSIKSILNVINPTSFDLGDDIPTCITTPVLIRSNVTAVTYSWSTGQTWPNIYALPGTYTLTINNGGCNSSDEVNVIIAEKKLSERFPNVITPNGDQVNDWIFFTKYNFDEIEFIVYDRWGRERLKITNPYEKWEPSDLENGTYFYVANYKSSCIGKFASDKGFISIFK